MRALSVGGQGCSLLLRVVRPVWASKPSSLLLLILLSVPLSLFQDNCCDLPLSWDGVMVTGGQCLAGLSIVVPAEGDRQAVALSQPTGFEHQTALALFLCACLMCVPGVCICVCVSVCMNPPQPRHWEFSSSCVLPGACFFVCASLSESARVIWFSGSRSVFLCPTICVCVCVCVCVCSVCVYVCICVPVPLRGCATVCCSAAQCVWLFATPWTTATQCDPVCPKASLLLSPTFLLQTHYSSFQGLSLQSTTNWVP